MARYFFDTEFYEAPGTLELISIGITNGSRELYMVSNEFNLPRVQADEWLATNVLPHLPTQDQWKSRAEIRDAVSNYFAADPNAELWGYYPGFDWVLLCWLFGRMIDMPQHMPFNAFDVRQLQWQLSIPSLPKKSKTKNHDALEDARWTKKAYEYVLRRNAGRAFWGVDSEIPGIDTYVN